MGFSRTRPGISIHGTIAGAQNILAGLKDQRARAAKPADFIDARFVEEFDKSGYIDKLYGRKQ
ncbi:MAG TPA: hypothetical protein VK200_10935 [Candidatus Limnocylindrales bacterium]|nr:hypothetical protein [Candidatus Limnocylindrales bacterium]